jgi:hypothetical protein
MGVRIVEGGSAFKDGGRVSCSLSSTPREVVLLDCHGGEKLVGSDGYFCLSRNVVSLKLQGTLRASPPVVPIAVSIAFWELG